MSLATIAQVDVDKSIRLTGTSTDARVEGVKLVSDSLDAVNAKSIQLGALTYGTASGSNDTFSVVLSPEPPIMLAGMVVHFLANQDVAGASSLEVNGLGVYPIKKNFNQDLAANDIKNGQAVSVIFDGTNWQMLSQLGNASTSGGGGGGSGSDPNTLIYTVTGF
jgi:hypothetical protein